MADRPCDTCKNFDPIVRGTDKTAKHGRCAPQSTYPAVQQPGQTFPPGVKRAVDGELAKPFIVVGAEVQKQCGLYRSAE